MSNQIIELTQAVVDNEPWLKMPTESAKAYAAFIAYRDMPPRDRSLRKAVVRHFGVSTSSKVRQFQTWSARWMWVDRASAWDEFKDYQAREEQLKAIKDANSKHIKIASSMLSKALERLKTMEPIELAPADLLRFITESVRIERMALGEPDTIQEVKQPDEEATFTMADLTDDELRQKIIQIRLKRKSAETK